MDQVERVAGFRESGIVMRVARMGSLGVEVPGRLRVFEGDTLIVEEACVTPPDASDVARPPASACTVESDRVLLTVDRIAEDTAASMVRVAIRSWIRSPEERTAAHRRYPLRGGNVGR